MSNRSTHAAKMWTLFSGDHAMRTRPAWVEAVASSSSCCAAGPESAPHKSAHAAHVP